MKKAIVIILAILMIYVTFISIEVIRFNNKPGSKPVIMLKEEKIDITKETGVVVKDYVGIGYTITYNYNVEYKKGSDLASIMILKGNFKLFNKYSLSMFVQ